MKNRILIIGSTGFIGKNATRFFTNKGYEVHSADIIIKNEENYTILNPEISDFSILFSQQKFDICLNATGAASVPLSFLYPAIDYSLNVSNVFNILEAIRKYNPECKFINLSSAAVYGNPESIPISENSAINPLSPYGFHKYYSELICKEFFTTFNIQTLSLRIFSAYGEGLKKQLFWDIFNKVQNSKDNIIILFGNGDESRDFIYINDLLSAIDLLIRNSNFSGNTVNVASGNEISIKDAVGTCVNKLNPNIKVVFNTENKKGDPKNWKADISILKSMGFKNEYSLTRGLNNYTKWLKKLYND